MTRDIKDIVKITEAARKYLIKKGKPYVVIEYPEYRTSCECVFVQIPEVFAKKPKKEESFLKLKIDGIDVFLSKSLTLPENSDIIVCVDSFLGIKTLSVMGFSSKD